MAPDLPQSRRKLRPPLGEFVDRVIVAVLREVGRENQSRLVRKVVTRLPFEERRNPDSVKKRIQKLAVSHGILVPEEDGRTVVYSLNTAEYDFGDVPGAPAIAGGADRHVRMVKETVVRPWRRQLPVIAVDGVFLAGRGPNARVPYRPPSVPLPVEAELLFPDVTYHVASATEDPTSIWTAFQDRATAFWVWEQDLRAGFGRAIASQGWEVSERPGEAIATPEVIDWLVVYAIEAHARSSSFARGADSWAPRIYRPRGAGVVEVRFPNGIAFLGSKGESPEKIRDRATRAWRGARAWARGEGAPLAKLALSAREDLVRLRKELDRRLLRCERVLISNPDCPFQKPELPEDVEPGTD